MHRELAGVLALTALGCAPPDIAPCGTIELIDTVNIQFIDRVDLLFVIDDSVSMQSERVHLVTEIPRLVNVLASGDRDGDGVRDFEPAESLHVGIVTTDVGGGTSGLAHCGMGTHGVLDRRSSTAAGCGAPPSSGIFDFRSERDDSVAFASDVGCTASAPLDGCGVEQPLEAALRALSLSAPTTWTRAGYEPPTFGDGSLGNGDGANAGFLRPDSMLAIVVITNEDDCSVSDIDGELAGLSASEEDPACGGAGLLPLERFVEGLVGLRSQASLLSFAVVGGVPISLIEAGANYDAILDDEVMQPMLDPSRPGHLLASCTSESGREATPPLRLVQVAEALDRLGSRTTVQSVCAEPLTRVADPLIEALAPTLVARNCLPRPLSPDDDGRVACEVDVMLAPPTSDGRITHCIEIEGATRLTDIGTSWSSPSADREVCRVPQLSRAEVAAEQVGWFYDDGDPRLGDASGLSEGCGQNIDVSRLELNGAELRVRCRAHSGDLPFCDE
jgi:hypothetical protein